MKIRYHRWSRSFFISLAILGLLSLNIILIKLLLTKNSIPTNDSANSTQINQVTPLQGVHAYNKNEDKNTYITQEMKFCEATGGTHDCYKRLANNLSSSFSLKESLTVLAQNEKVPEVYDRCHEITHYLGRNDYDKSKSISSSFAACNSTCQGGCYHGVIEEYLKVKNLSINSPEFATTVRQMCGKPTDYSMSYIYYECLHGTGHAAMFVTENDLPTSLSICDYLKDTSYTETCYSGVFMENSSSSTANGHTSEYVKADDPLFPCDSLDQKYQKICYTYQSSYFAIITHDDWGKTAQLCLKVPLLYQKDCLSTIGSSQVGFTQDKNVMNANCMKVPQAYQQDCVNAVITSMATRFVGNSKMLSDFCSITNKNYQQSCFAEIKTSTKMWNTSQNAANFVPQ